jgi:hypothetical protein
MGAALPHSLRHSAITFALDAGASPRDVQDYAGHKDPRTTRRQKSLATAWTGRLARARAAAASGSSAITVAKASTSTPVSRNRRGAGEQAGQPVGEAIRRPVLAVLFGASASGASGDADLAVSGRLHARSPWPGLGPRACQVLRAG